MGLRKVMEQALACFFISHAPISGADYLVQVKCPQQMDAVTEGQPLVIAIVDDGIRRTHQQILPYLWSNSNEVPANQIDDDGNGWTDDVHGWDISDSDQTLSPPRHRQQDFYHGTHSAGIIAQMASTAYGAAGPDHIRLMGVKCISDEVHEMMYLKDGYKGIAYALDNGADIILCAWGGRSISSEEKKVLDRVHQQGVLLIASAGNLPEEREQYPAAHSAVLAVSGIDAAGQKINRASYGTFVDLMAPSEHIIGADVSGDNQYSYRSGTSFAAAIAAGAAAILMRQFPDETPEQIKARLMNAADPLSAESELHEARLGAGCLNLKRALRADVEFSESIPIKHSKGYLVLTGKAAQSWTLQPDGRIKGIRLRTAPGSKASGLLRLHRENGGGHKPQDYRIHNHSEQEFYLAGTPAHISFEPDGEQPPGVETLLHFSAEPVDLSKLYCHGIEYVEEECVLTDGSGTNSYSPNTDAKWLITAPPGKEVQFTFTAFETEPDIDKVYLFNGSGTHEQIIAVFSGTSLPPKLTSWSNQTLMWFVSDGKHQQSGWNVEVKFVEQRSPPKNKN